MAGSVLHQLHTLTDTAIVGKVLGVEALAALVAADWFCFLVLSTVTGFSQGFAWGHGIAQKRAARVRATRFA